MGQMGGNMVQESEDSIPTPDWNSDLVIFEHINGDSGGRLNRDPGKQSRARSYEHPLKIDRQPSIPAVLMRGTFSVWDKSSLCYGMWMKMLAKQTPSLTRTRLTPAQTTNSTYNQTFMSVHTQDPHTRGDSW